jgi:PPK2 family polyphosphate:nucleotide phosphotransferase
MPRDHRPMRELLRIPPGPVVLSGHDPAATPGAPGDKEETLEHLDDRSDELAELQERLFAEGTAEGATRRVLVVLQGMDTCGKGGTIKHVIGRVDPLGIEIAAFKKPTAEELAHHFLWRVRRRVPPPGKIGIFDRSHYEDVLVVRVHDLVAREVWAGRYDEINAFESELAREGVTLLKVFLHISFEEQRRRLLARLEDPTKRWKFNPGDLEERQLWPRYMEAYEAVLERCNPAGSPWYLVPADHKWYRNWAVANLLLETLGELDPRYPVREDLDLDALVERLSTQEASTQP